MSLSRLWQQQGRRDAARALLTEVYGGFTEGFDTADLHAAQTLLQALGSPPIAEVAGPAISTNDAGRRGTYTLAWHSTG